MTTTNLSSRLLLTLVCSLAALTAALAQTAQTTQPSQNPAQKSIPSSWGAVPQMSEAQQQNFSSQLLSELEAIKTAALADDYAYRQLAHLTENIGPRPSGSSQAKAAADYVAAELRKLGLEVQLEEVQVPHWVRGTEKAELVEYAGQVPGTTQKIVLTALGGSTSTGAEGIVADVVVVNNFDELKTLGRDQVAGKIVLFNELFDKRMAAAGLSFAAYGEAVSYRGAGPKAAADLGAAAALVRSVGTADYRLPHTGWSAAAEIPAGAVAAEDADLIAHLATQGKVRMRLILTPQKLPDTTGYNVIADLKGSEHPEQIVIVSGHLDSWDLGTGAIDDGAGVVVAMEAAELLQKLHLRPKRTLRVIAWMDEETGGSGSQGYSKDHASEFADHVAAIESDAGAAHALGFDIKITPAAAELLRPVSDVLTSIGASALQPSNSSPGADITHMSDAGVPTLGLLVDERNYFNYHHTAADTLDKVVPSELREDAAAMAVMGYALASMKEPLPR
ncbi:MAG TPA: M20/M25/M40 family metallo-hydrolase [Candidatus Acidoferrales bacterium]|nr:M20/M25/M40 family metallo-hydrolase [Candidatus Acidoferrales bacterium]